MQKISIFGTIDRHFCKSIAEKDVILQPLYWARRVRLPLARAGCPLKTFNVLSVERQ